MAGTKKYTIEDLMKQSEQSLAKSRELRGIADAAVSAENESLTKEILRNAQSILELGVDLELDGYFEIDVAEDDSEAVMSCYPPSGAKDPINLESVYSVLEAKKISVGIDDEAIRNAVFRCNTERIPVEDVVVARSIPPVPEIPEHIEIDESAFRPEKKEDPDALRTDFREQSPFVIIEKDQVVARRVPVFPGRMGETIKGAPLEFRRSNLPTYRPGKNIRADGEYYRAACTGRLNLQGETFWVNPVLEIQSDVSYKTGNINFPGDVVIHGEVKSGFKVNSGGAIRCLNTLDATEVDCKLELVVDRGIVGRGTGVVRAGGSITTRFIENCFVEARGDLYVENGILNSHTNTHGTVRTGAKGLIVGGRVSAQEGVMTRQIGTLSGPKTEIYCGTDFEIEHKLEVVRDQTVELAIKLKRVQGQIKYGEGGVSILKKLELLEQKLKTAIHTLNESASALVFQVAKNEEAQVVVAGPVHVGTYIEICHLPYVVTKELFRVRFALDKEKGCVVCAPLSSNPYAQ